MIQTATQLKALVRNMSKGKSKTAQLLTRSYMMERFLERLSLSGYKDMIILKGGMLIASMVGVTARSTRDIDATVRGIEVTIENVEKVLADIASIPIDDNVNFRIKKTSKIMEEANYPGIRVNMETEFDGMRIPLKIDVSTGDVITPREIDYKFKLMLEDRYINILAYNTETVLAEKMETIISRALTNTRMRDFYDIHVLLQLYGNSISIEDLRNAILATAKKRKTFAYMENGTETLAEIQESKGLRDHWNTHQKEFSYAANYSWEEIMHSVQNLYKMMF